MISEDHEVRLEACKELVDYPTDAIDILINTFTDKNPLVRFQAAKSLASIGQDSIKPLISALKSDNILVQKYVILALKDIGDDTVAKELINALGSEDFAI